MVGRELAILDPEGFLGAHVLQLFSFPSGDPAEFEGFGPKEYAALEHMQWFQSVGGYNAMNGSRPQTVAAGLSDSPVGQLAYSELFESFGNGTSLVHARAGAGAGHAVLAHEHRRRLGPLPLRGGARRARARGQHGSLGVAVFKDDFQTIRSLAERDNANIQHWSEFDRGGHFAVLENPDAIVGDLRAFSAQPADDPGSPAAQGNDLVVVSTNNATRSMPPLGSRPQPRGEDPAGEGTPATGKPGRGRRHAQPYDDAGSPGP